MADHPEAKSPAKTWLDHAGDFISLAENAKAVGNTPVMITALQRAADCIQIQRNLDRASILLGKGAAIQGDRNEG